MSRPRSSLQRCEEFGLVPHSIVNDMPKQYFLPSNSPTHLQTFSVALPCPDLSTDSQKRGLPVSRTCLSTSCKASAFSAQTKS